VAKFSILVGVILIATGYVAYNGLDKSLFGGEQAAVQNAADGTAAAPEKKSVTALIPTFVGFPILILGTLALQPGWRKQMMHLVSVIAFLGAGAGLGRGLSKLGVFMSAEDYSSRRPVLFSLIMGALCLILLIGCIYSFMSARKQRLSESANS